MKLSLSFLVLALFCAVAVSQDSDEQNEDSSSEEILRAVDEEINTNIEDSSSEEILRAVDEEINTNIGRDTPRGYFRCNDGKTCCQRGLMCCVHKTCCQYRVSSIKRIQC